MGKGNFATAINCIDGRVQLPIINWLQKEYKIDYVDMVTEPGPNLILAENKQQETIDSIKDRVMTSTNKHNSKLVAIVGHYDCAANLGDKEAQLRHIRESIKLLNSWELGVDAIGLWVDSDWQTERVV